MVYLELQYGCSVAFKRDHEGTIMRKDEDAGILQAALLGYQQQLEIVNTKMSELRRRLGTRATSTPGITNSRPHPKKHRISPEGRARIAAAQRRRWAAAKKAGS